jgi:hypothetical protein
VLFLKIKEQESRGKIAFLRRRKKKGKKRQDEVMRVRRGAPSNTQTLICLTVTGLQRNMSMPFGDEKNITENSKEKGTDDE